MLRLGCRFISPSQHVAEAFNSVYGAGRCQIINNGIDLATEAILAQLSPVPLNRANRELPLWRMTCVMTAKLTSVWYTT